MRQVLLRGLRVKQAFLTTLERKEEVDMEVRRAAGIFQGRGGGKERGAMVGRCCWLVCQGYKHQSGYGAIGWVSLYHPKGQTLFFVFFMLKCFI